MSDMIDIDDRKSALSHIMLQDSEVCAEIAQTDSWKNDRNLHVEVRINGVKVPARVFDEMIEHWYSSLTKQIEEQTGFLEKANAVETAAKEMLEEKFKELQERLFDVSHALDGLDPFLNFEREKALEKRIEELKQKLEAKP